MNPLEKPRCILMSAFLSIPLLLLAPARLAANPVETDLLWTNVHPWDPNFCASESSWNCNSFTNYTTATGDVEFDLYLSGPRYISSGSDSLGLEVTCYWTSPDWSFTTFESCSGGTASFTIEDGINHAARCTIDWAPQMPPPPFFGYRLLGRIRMQVVGEGRLGCFGGMYLGTSITGVNEGEAGGTGCFCESTCNLSPGDFPCHPSFFGDTLRVSVPQGRVAEGSMYMVLDDPNKCPVTFDPDQSWMQASVTPGGNWFPQLVATVDATNLLPGRYVGRIYAHAGCVVCCPVAMLVTGATPVRRLSWGQIKSAFR